MIQIENFNEASLWIDYLSGSAQQREVTLRGDNWMLLAHRP